MSKDPVCGIKLKENFSNIKSAYWNEKRFSFCGSECARKFKQNPQKFQGTPLLKLENVGKIYNLGKTKVTVLHELNFNIWEGDFVVIIGASGSGKSTTLNLMGLLDKPTSGKVFLRGKDTSLLNDKERARLRSKTFGFIFQQYNLIPWLNAYENVILPLTFSGKKINAQVIKKQFENIDIAKALTHHPLEMSGGEQQRVAFLRAMANNPNIILGDEPTGNLDSISGNKILKLLTDFNKEKKKTLVIITHDANIAEKADLILTIKDGTLIQNRHSAEKLYAAKLPFSSTAANK